MKRCMGVAEACALALVAAACGGSSGSSDSITFDPTSIAITVTQGQVGTATVHATLSRPYDGDTYPVFAAADSGGALGPNLQIVYDSLSEATLTVFTSSALSAGTHSGTLTLAMCNDEACNHPIFGSPYALSYTITVTEPPPLDFWLRGSWAEGWPAASAIHGFDAGDGKWAFRFGDDYPAGDYLFKIANSLTWPASPSDPLQSGLFGNCSTTDMTSPAASGASCTNGQYGGNGGNLMATFGPNVVIEFRPASATWVALDPAAAPAWSAPTFDAMWLRGAWSGWSDTGAVAGVKDGHAWTFTVPPSFTEGDYALKIVSSLTWPTDAADPLNVGVYGTCYGYDFVVPMAAASACPNTVLASVHTGDLMMHLAPNDVVHFDDATGAWSK